MDVQSYIDACDAILMRSGAQRSVLFEVGGYTVYGYVLARPESARNVYLSTGMHGDEPAGPHALLALLQEGILGEAYSWFICPLLNPTGLAAGTRENARGFDLNRDYLQQRSEEVAGHTQWLEGKQIDFAISLHEDWESTGFYFYEINQIEDRPQRYARMVEAVSAVMPMEPSGCIDGHQVREKGWIYHGCEPDEVKRWPEAIYLAKQQCPLSFTFETPSSLPLVSRVRAHQLAVRAALRMAIGV